MKEQHLDTIIVVTVFLAVLAMSTIFVLLPRPTERVYNCGIAEISPDIPIKVKEECRKLRMDQIK